MFPNHKGYLYEYHKGNLYQSNDYVEIDDRLHLLFRFFFEHLGYTDQWRKAMAELTDSERDELYPIIFHNDFNHIEELTSNEKFRHILSFYKNYRGDIANHNSELYKLKQKFDQKENGD